MKQTIKKRIEDINNGFVPEGYKKTVVGVCPIEWEEHTIADFLQFKNGLNKEKEAFGSGTPIINYTDVYKKRGLKGNDIKGRVQLLQAEISNYEAKEGDVFFTRTSETIDEIGFSSVLLEPIPNAVFSGFILRGRPYNDMVAKEYHQYCYSSSLMRSEIKKRSSMTTRALTSGPMLCEVSINLPSKIEQSKIAKILMKWDEAVELQEQHIQKLELRKKAIMKILLTPRVGWNKCRLIEIVNKTKGRAVKIDEEGRMPIIDMEYIDKGKPVNYTNERGVWAQARDILLLWDGANAGTLLTNIEGVVGSTFAVLALKNNKIFSGYLYYWLKMQNETNLSIREGSGIPHVQKDYLRKQIIIFPEEAEQKKISEILSSSEDEISLQKEKLEKIKQQRKAMQQYLLTGIVRVKE